MFVDSAGNVGVYVCVFGSCVGKLMLALVWSFDFRIFALSHL